MSPRKMLHSEKLGLLVNSMWGSAKNAIGVCVVLVVLFWFGACFVCLGSLFMGEFGGCFSGLLKKCWQTPK